jgi:cytochrome c-type biogenesis protein CcmH/NrfG
MAELRAGRLDDALPLLERGATQAPDDFVAQSAYGRGLVQQMSEVRNDQSATSAILPKARAALQRAVTLDPRSANAAWMMAYAELTGGGDIAAATVSLQRAIQLDPTRDDYKLLLAQTFARQQDFRTAMDQLGPLMAAGRTAETRSEARRLMADLANRVNALSTPAPSVAAAAGPAVAAPAAPARAVPVPAASAPAAGDAVSAARGSARPMAFGLDLRAVREGEVRVLGTFQAIECVNDTIVLRVAGEGRTLSLRTKVLADVDLISYRPNPPSRVGCGPVAGRPQVYATYRPSASGGVDGVAVAIELLPDGFVPTPGR